MNYEKERAITYSLLAHIRNTGTLAKGPIDIFIPLIKRALSILNNEGIYKGKSILEIKNRTDVLYNIDFPIPVLKKILDEICKEINTVEATHFTIYSDGAFNINKYTFTDYEDLVLSQEKEIDELEELFKRFCETSEFEIANSDSIFKFIEKNKFTLSKYISNKQSSNVHDYTPEAQFIDFFRRIPSIYERIKNIYLGSIIAGYIEYNPDGVKREIELLLDTNFLVGLLDLNTPESTHTCRTLIKIAKQQGFRITVLKDTIEETKNLLETKASFFEKSFLQKKVNPEDVYNACDRRNISKIDLERIADKLEDITGTYGISMLFQTDKLNKEAKFTEEYKIFEEVRKSKRSALHDATALLYIRKQRGKKIKEFEKVNAWFVNNSASVEGDNIYLKDGFQPETIKADDLLNILWLSNPQINKEISGEDLAEIGLTSIISLTLNKNLPKSQILRELDDNIHKYAKEEISDTDIVRVATRITNKQLKDIEGLNILAEKDKEQFVKRLEEEAAKQKRIEVSRIRKLEKVFEEISNRSVELEKTKKTFEKKSEGFDKVLKLKDESESKVIQLEAKLLEQQNKIREEKRDQWLNKQIFNWRRKSWIEFIISILIVSGVMTYILYISNWSIKNASKYIVELQSNIIISGIFSLIIFIISAVSFRTLLDKYRNHSNIENYKKGLKIPEEYKELKKAP
jgi:predicted nucleic acid-binding protein